MRASIAVFLLIVLVLGCHSSPPTHDTDLAVWRSPNASIKKRWEAASRLVPKGTKQIEAEQVLGEPTHGERFDGPIIYAPGYEGPTNATYLDIWRDRYDFSGGDYIALTFDMQVSVTSWEDRPLLGIETGNTYTERLFTIPTNKK